MTQRILTLRDALSLADILNAACNQKRVRRAMNGIIAEGTARGITDKDGRRWEGDVRDGHLHVTLASGFEAYWPISDAITAYQEDRLIIG